MWGVYGSPLISNICRYTTSNSYQDPLSIQIMQVFSLRRTEKEWVEITHI